MKKELATWALIGVALVVGYQFAEGFVSGFNQTMEESKVK